MERKLDFKPCVVWVGGDAFVQVVDVKLKGIVADLSLEIKVINKLESVLTKIEYEVYFYDSGEVKLQEESYHVDGEAIKIAQNEIAVASKLNISKSFPNARRAEVKLLKAYFDDGKSIDLLYEEMEKFAINEINDEDLRLLQKVAGDDSHNLPAKLTLNWRCVCGYFNGDDSKFCNNCFREKNQVLSDYRSIDYIKENIEKELQGNVDEEEPKQEEIKEDVKEEKSKEKVDVKGEFVEFFSNSSKSVIIFLLLASIFLFSSVFTLLLN